MSKRQRIGEKEDGNANDEEKNEQKRYIYTQAARERDQENSIRNDAWTTYSFEHRERTPRHVIDDQSSEDVEEGENEYHSVGGLIEGGTFTTSSARGAVEHWLQLERAARSGPESEDDEPDEEEEIGLLASHLRQRYGVTHNQSDFGDSDVEIDKDDESEYDEDGDRIPDLV